uniref:Solute carrier family 16 member 6 n=1 Tax=Sinocyclocheilus grahami TaxID=75366 RepID=A0A672SR30_SINGR
MAQCIFRIRGCLGSKVYSEVPDGGWGWIVAVAFFLVEVNTDLWGLIKSFGIFLKDLMSDFGESNSRVSRIISICVFVMTFTVVIFGGFLISLGTISTAFTSSINQMYLTIGIVTGSRRRSVVTAMASIGESFAIFAFAPAFTALKNFIGWRYTMVVIGTLQGIITCGALLCPIVNSSNQTSSTGAEQKITCSLPEEQMQGSASSGDSGVQSLDEEAEPLQISSKQQDVSTKNMLLHFTVLKEGSFLCYSAFGLFATLGFFTPHLYVVELSASLGTERDKTAYMLSTMAIAEIFGRLYIRWVLNWGRIRKIFVMDDVVGIQRMPLAVGVYICIQSFAGLAGVLVDVTQNYRAAFYSCAVGMGLGAVFLGLIRPAKTGQPCLRRDNGQNNPIVEQVSKDKLEKILEVDNQDIKS